MASMKSEVAKSGVLAQKCNVSRPRLPQRSSSKKKFDDHATVNLTLNPVVMRSIVSCVSLAVLIQQVQSLYFYIDGPTQKCFFEELPKDTLVVGMHRRI